MSTSSMEAHLRFVSGLSSFEVEAKWKTVCLSSLTNQNLKFYLTVKDAEEKQSLVISLQFKVYVMIVWGGGGCLCTLNE